MPWLLITEGLSPGYPGGLLVVFNIAGNVVLSSVPALAKNKGILQDNSPTITFFFLD